MGEAILLGKGPAKKPKLYAIAYLDLLGTTAKINSKHDFVHLNELYRIYDLAVQLSENERISNSRYKEIKTKIFSDNIVIAMPLRSTPKNRVEDILCLLDFVSLFQNNAVIHHSWLIRGGITIGELFMDKLMIWGKGLIRAYKLESELAFYPRIILDQTIVDAIDVVDNTYVSKDSDGFWFLNFLNYNMKVEYHYDFFKEMKNSYVRMLMEMKGKDGIYPDKPFQKVQWYRNYANNWYRGFSNNVDDLLSDTQADLLQIS